MIDAIAIDMHPPAMVQLAKKRGSSRNRNGDPTGTDRSNRGLSAWHYVGAIWLVGDNNEECIAFVTPDGQWFCRDESGQAWRLPE